MGSVAVRVRRERVGRPITGSDVGWSEVAREGNFSKKMKIWLRVFPLIRYGVNLRNLIN